ncbi:amidophosphoribosyltransferase [Bacteroidales bacterium OttesenSCG-928-K03]|nr:amidophosphoribosyltransferase [Odoribacter sp. OttesenSCG-928-L07]MDL2239018.1 amidophosphoribosyltransferase [Bacteroidales bacterium OttesenSCG-928-L14]MDL2242144.1 amidophosphoribosyltransferase [Bacteroidales bacterium OttesenSCG-928-K03]
MSEPIKHECGIAFIRLLKPLDFYKKKYGTYFYALNKMQLLMEKQHNRGQDGAGLACIKFDLPPGVQYIDRLRSNDSAPIKDLFRRIFSQAATALNGNYNVEDQMLLKETAPFIGETYLGHLRYGTYGNNDIHNLHPVMRKNNWKTRNLVLAGNFNLTNIPELFSHLEEIGQFPQRTTDTVTILEKIGHFLDDENERLYRYFKNEGINKYEATKFIIENIDILSILQRSTKKWDGGYVIGGMFGHGDSFILRDPAGIRPAFYYIDDEVVVAASERPVIQTTFNVKVEDIHELLPGQTLIVKYNGKISLDYFVDEEAINPSPCSFERIYFSRGTDKDIYNERKLLGKYLCDSLLEKADYDIKNTIFSYIPNTAVDAYYGLMNELNCYCDKIKYEQICSHGRDITQEEMKEILNFRPRFEKVAVKDIKLRTFITEDSERDDLVAHVYDTTYGLVKEGVDNLVIIDDSIVRGTTLRQSIIKILDRLGPKHIIIGSSAPQIRYPDCYGIDMAKLPDFIAFNAAIALLKERNMQALIDKVYNDIIIAKENNTLKDFNYVKQIYSPFSTEEISDKISELVKPKGCNAKVSIVFQSIENLHKACPNNHGDWYFTGNYPTPGGNRVANLAFINFYLGKNERAY